MGAPEVPPLCRETQSLGQQLLKTTVGTNGLIALRLFYNVRFFRGCGSYTYMCHTYLCMYKHIFMIHNIYKTLLSRYRPCFVSGTKFEF